MSNRKKLDYGYCWTIDSHTQHYPIFDDPQEAWDWIENNAGGGCWNVTRACPYCEIALCYDKHREEYFCPDCEPRG